MRLNYSNPNPARGKQAAQRQQQQPGRRRGAKRLRSAKTLPGKRLGSSPPISPTVLTVSRHATYQKAREEKRGRSSASPNRKRTHSRRGVNGSEGPRVGKAELEGEDRRDGSERGNHGDKKEGMSSPLTKDGMQSNGFPLEEWIGRPFRTPKQPRTT